MARVFYYSGYLGLTLKEAFGGGGLYVATWLSLIGIVVLSLGVWTARRGMPILSYHRIEKEVQILSPRRVFLAYLLGVLFANYIGPQIAFKFPRVSQFILALEQVRWILLFLLFIVVIKKQKEYRFLLLAIGIEIFTGFLGYFAGFKNFLLIFAAALGASKPKLEAKKVLLGVAGIALVLILALFWMSARSEYRTFLNQGTDRQAVLVPAGDRIEKLYTLASHTSWQDLGDGVKPLVDRLGYIEWFGHTVEHVPSMVPYQEGKLWMRSVLHVLCPRLFFPNKQAIHDSEVTTKYTGIPVAGASSGTSIAIGYFAESYVDFGKIGMFVPIFVIGYMFGFIYNILIRSSKSKIISFGAATSVLAFGTYRFMSSPLVLGQNITNFIIVYFIVWILGQKVVKYCSS